MLIRVASAASHHSNPSCHSRDVVAVNLSPNAPTTRTALFSMSGQSFIS